MLIASFTLYTSILTAAEAQLVRAYSSHAEGWVFESQPRKTTNVRVMGPRR